MRNFNFPFFAILVCVSFSFLSSAWAYHQSEKIVLSNQQYNGISIEQERNFNKWDLERTTNLFLAVGEMFFLLTLAYLFFCIEFKSKGGKK